MLSIGLKLAVRTEILLGTISHQSNTVTLRSIGKYFGNPRLQRSPNLLPKNMNLLKR
jgi:hypothetical protein